MNDFDTTLTKAIAGDNDAFKVILDAIQKKQLIQKEKNELLAATATENIIKNNSYALCLRGLAIQHGYIPNQTSAERYAKAISLYKQAIKLNNENVFAMTELAIIYHFGKGGIGVNYPEAIRLFEQASKLNHTTAINNLAILYATEESGELNYSRSSYLLRKAYMYSLKNNNSIHAQRSKESLKRLFTQKVKTTHPDYLTVAYHHALVNREENHSFNAINNLMKIDPAQFLALVANDEFLSQKEKLDLTSTCISKYSSAMQKITDQESLNLVGEYWMSKAEDFLEPNNIASAIWAYQNVPQNSVHYGSACSEIATHLYLKNRDSLGEKTAFEHARSYFEKATDTTCIMLYEGCLLDALGEDKIFSNVSERIPQDKLKDLQQRYLETTLIERLTTIMQTLPLAITQVYNARTAEKDLLHTNPSNLSNNIFNIFSASFKSQSSSTLMANTGQQQKVANIVQHGLVALKKSDNSSADLSEIASYFLEKVQTLKNTFPKTITNTTQPLIDLENQLTSFIAELKHEKKNEPAAMDATPKQRM